MVNSTFQKKYSQFLSRINLSIFFLVHIKGLTEYTKSGFEKASKYFDNRDINIDMSNRAVMITGANSGIGKSTALELAKRGAMVYIVCRDFKKGESAQREIKAISRNSVNFFVIT